MSKIERHRHRHEGQKCPVTGRTHEFCPAQEGDSRSICPALNAMANHGYISRDGKNISPQEITRGLKACYGLSNPLAYFLSYVGFFLIFRKFRRVDLFEIGKHGAVEHDASLVHHDTPSGSTYAPIEVDPHLVGALFADVRPSEIDVEAASISEGRGSRPGRFLMDAEDVARARIRREGECRPIGRVAAEIARGEMAIALGVWEVETEAKTGIPVAYVRRWISEERLPEGWKPDHTQSLLDVVRRSRGIKKAAERLRKESSDLEKK